MKNPTLSGGSLFAVAAASVAMLGVGIAGCAGPGASPGNSPATHQSPQAHGHGHGPKTVCNITATTYAPIGVSATTTSPMLRYYQVAWGSGCKATQVKLDVYGVYGSTACYYGTKTLDFSTPAPSPVTVPIYWCLGNHQPTGSFPVQRRVAVTFENENDPPATQQNTTYTAEAWPCYILNGKVKKVKSARKSTRRNTHEKSPTL
jgi:hypothetical protein